MLFGHHVIDKTFDEHVRDIADLASDPQTLIFLDTNILSYLYKLHEAARQEFFAWSDAVAATNRLVVPAWAASEYLARVTSKNLDSYTPKSKEVEQVKRLLGGLFDTASLFVDDASLRRIGFVGDRAAYLANFRAAITSLSPFTGVFSQDFDPGVIHRQIESHLSPVILDSDLAELCVRASNEGPGRFEHRMPPGFRDEDKPENRFGDLIIWFEILAKSASSTVDFPKVLFISRDEKSDWVYAPKMRMEIVRGVRKPVGNARPEIKLADPRLVSEFCRATGHANVTITSIGTLVEGLSKTNPTQFTHLAAAIQINIEESAPSTTPAAEEPAPPDSAESIEVPAPEVPADGPALPTELQPEPIVDNLRTDGQVEVPELPAAPQPELVPAQLMAPAPPRLQYELEALQDSHYQADAPPAINAVIRALKSHNWYTQNPAIATIRTFRNEDFTPSSWFVLGRNLYQAACGNSQKAMEFMVALETQLKQFPQATAQHLLAGMLYEIYFDAQGEFRTSAKFGYADKPMAIVADPFYEEALEFISFQLHDYRARLKFQPGERNSKTLQITSEPVPSDPEENPDGQLQELRSVTLDGVELLREINVEARDAWERMLDRTKLTQERIRAKVSEELAIPRWALVNQFHPAVRGDAEFVVPEGRKLDPSLALQDT